MSSRIGVDIGGTFTDFIVYDESGNKVIKPLGVVTSPAKRISKFSIDIPVMDGAWLSKIIVPWLYTAIGKALE